MKENKKKKIVSKMKSRFWRFQVSTTQMFTFLFNTVAEASKIILNAGWRYQKYSTTVGGYVGKKIWIMRYVEMNNWRKLTKKIVSKIKNEKSILEVSTTEMFNSLCHFLQFFISTCRTIQIFLPTYPPKLVEYFSYLQRAFKMIFDASETVLNKKLNIWVVKS